MSKSWEGTWGSLSVELLKLAGDEIKRKVFLVFAVKAVFHNADGDLPIYFASWVLLVENTGLVQAFKKLAQIRGGQCEDITCMDSPGPIYRPCIFVWEASPVQHVSTLCAACLCPSLLTVGGETELWCCVKALCSSSPAWKQLFYCWDKVVWS